MTHTLKRWAEALRTEHARNQHLRKGIAALEQEMRLRLTITEGFVFERHEEAIADAAEIDITKRWLEKLAALRQECGG